MYDFRLTLETYKSSVLALSILIILLIISFRLISKPQSFHKIIIKNLCILIPLGLLLSLTFYSDWLTENITPEFRSLSFQVILITLIVYPIIELLRGSLLKAQFKREFEKEIKQEISFHVDQEFFLTKTIPFIKSSFQELFSYINHPVTFFVKPVGYLFALLDLICLRWIYLSIGNKYLSVALSVNNNRISNFVATNSKLCTNLSEYPEKEYLEDQKTAWEIRTQYPENLLSENSKLTQAILDLNQQAVCCIAQVDVGTHKILFICIPEASIERLDHAALASSCSSLVQALK